MPEPVSGLPLHPGPAFTISQVARVKASLCLPLGRALNLGSRDPSWTCYKIWARLLYLSERVICKMGIINPLLWRGGGGVRVSLLIKSHLFKEVITEPST